MTFRPSGIKQQTLLIMVSFAIGLTLLYLGLSIVTAYIVEDTMISKVMKRQAQLISRQYQLDGTVPVVDESVFTIYTDEHTLPDWVRQAIAENVDDQEIFTPDNRHFHYQAIYLGEQTKGYLLAEVSPWLVVSNQPKVFQTFIIGLLLALLIAIFLAFRLTRYMVAPVLQLSRAVQQKQNVQGKAHMPPLEHELGYLSDSMQATFDRLDHALQREQNFTKDVSHELRTPLTVLNNTVTLMMARGSCEQDIEDIRSATEKLTLLVEQLFVLARGESHHSQRCLLKPALEQALLSNPDVDLSVWDIELLVDDKQQVNAPPALLNMLFGNIIENVFRHASARKMTIQWHQQTLSVTNPITQTLPSNITHSQVKSPLSSGLGQGLFLVERICQQCQWHLTTSVLDDNDKQFQVAIDFQPPEN